MNKLNVVLLVSVLLANTGTLYAQEPIALYDPVNLYNQALELFEHEKYVPAKEKFEQYIAESRDPQHALRINAEYYSGICALYLFHKDAEFVLEKFVREHPDSPWKQHVYFELATFYHKKKGYKKALEWFEQVDVNDLSNTEKQEFFFKRGQSRFEEGDNANARLDFIEVKDQESEYAQAATYYYSHIAYEQDDFQAALEGFSKLDNDPAFRPVVPYYIAQIYYKQKKYDELIAYGPAVLDSARASSTKRAPEIALLIGDAYFIKENYEAAIPYLEQHAGAVSKSGMKREEFYQLGYAYYRVKNYEKALENFNECTNEEDELHQLAVYNMGDCYLNLSQKEYARNAFKSASEKSFNTEIREDAMFNYAKLAFELSFNPFHEAITAFESYLDQYPNSPRRDEAYEFLLNVYLKTRNYERAITSLDKIQNKDSRIKEAYQLVAYNRAVELFNSERYTDAKKFFDMVATYPINPTLTAESTFWKAEIAYKDRDYPKAKSLYNTFLADGSAYGSQYFNLANYGLGYTWFKQAIEEKNNDVAKNSFASANTAFRKYSDSPGNTDPKKLNDAWLRIGDCFYVAKSYGQAITYYDRVSDAEEGNKDYAMFQKAICYGFDGQSDKKAWVLKNLLSEMPNSKFGVDARFELAKTYLASNKLSEAKSYYNDIVENFPATAHAKHALKDLCLVYVKEGNESKIRETWNQLYSTYPNDPILKDAVAIVRSTLIEDVQFQQQISGMTILDVKKEEIENEVFGKAEDHALSGDCNKAIEKLNQYLQQYQPAYYALEAHYYLGNCYFEKGETQNALVHYNYVLDQPLNNYSEECLVVAATINYNNKSYEVALQHYVKLEQIAVRKNNILEGQIGQMRCHFFLGNRIEARDAANKVISDPNTPEDIRIVAHLWRGRIRMDEMDYIGANSDFKEVLKKGGVSAAEAKYHISNMLYLQGEYKKCESEIFDLIGKYSAFEEWKFKGFLLLSDAYIGMKDYFQARATLNAILENVDEQWVRDEALARLKTLDALENNENSTDPADENIEIDLGGGNNE